MIMMMMIMIMIIIIIGCTARVGLGFLWLHNYEVKTGEKKSKLLLFHSFHYDIGLYCNQM